MSDHGHDDKPVSLSDFGQADKGQDETKTGTTAKAAHIDTENKPTSLLSFLENWREARSVGTEDVLAAILPLMKQLVELHADGKVGPIINDENIFADHGHLYFPANQALEPRRAYSKVNVKRAATSKAIEVVEELTIISDDTTGIEIRDKTVRDFDDDNIEPGYLTHFGSWEDRVGHHDPLTDIFCVGMICAALATNLDFREREQLETFVTHRSRLHQINNRLHPVLCRAIERMTSLHRYDRVQDLSAMVMALENHRRIGASVDLSLTDIAGFTSDERHDAKTILLKRLRARLYDMTRRNRLIYHRRVAGELNLTEASVPLVMSISSIRESELFTTVNPVFRKLLKGDEIKMGEFIRFEEMAFAPSVLAKIRTTAARDLREFGGSSLRLVPVFLRWYDLKNAPEEPISSPLLLMRVELKKRKGVKDAYTLKLLDSQAEINPALAFMLDSLYGIKLPNFVDLSEPTALKNLHEFIQTSIMSSEPGVSLEFASKPKLRILHKTVRRRLDKFNKRRAHRTRGVRSRGSLRYQYERKNYNPLGLQMYREYVEVPEAPNRSLFGSPSVRQYQMVAASEPSGAVTEKKVEQFETINETKSKFAWSFDLCSVTLANFNYRKMSLVRDYDSVLKGDTKADMLFDLFFTSDARPEEKEAPLLPAAEQFPIVPSDPTQQRSVLKVRTGESYVIQGPPGTGKSQTIANLIADIVSQDKRVLFVCEKRAALDVVYNRLRGVGLNQLCALVHDAQENKREFIKELERLYEDWSEDATLPPNSKIEQSRQSELLKIGEVEKDIDLLVTTLRKNGFGADEPLYELLNAYLSSPKTGADYKHSTENMPEIKDWRRYETDIRKASASLRRLTGTSILAERPERLIDSNLWKRPDIGEAISKFVDTVLPSVTQLASAQTAFQSSGHAITLSEACAQASLAHRLLPAVEAGYAGLYNPDSPEAGQYKTGLRLLEDSWHKVVTAQKDTEIWQGKLSPRDCRNALSLAEQKEGKLFAFLSKDWRNTKKLVLGKIDQSALSVKPNITNLLRDLQTEHQATDIHKDKARELARRFGFEDLSTIEILLMERDTLDPAEGPGAIALWQAVQKDPSGMAEHVKAISRHYALAQTLLANFDGQIADYDKLPLEVSVNTLRSLSENKNTIRELQPVFAPLAQAPETLWKGLRSLAVEPDEMQRAILTNAIRRSLNNTPGLSNVDANALMDIRKRLHKHESALQNINADLLIRRAIDKFAVQADMRNTPDRDLSMPDRALKSDINKGRRALEHEFGKTRAYRSPRELLSGPAGAVLPTLKPIWLMSPLSVADVLPLSTDLFDVVIFDEASQIPIEDAVPTVLRAPQVIVVGDDKQLPPTNFFGAVSDDDDFDAVADEDMDFELDQESFLSLAAEKLPATMLGWHYRSRSEELIGFSNEAFYAGKLLTIPSVRKSGTSKEIVVKDLQKLPVSIDNILRRPISFNYLPDGIYNDRRNTSEANYIAQLVRALLNKDGDETIGVVAFSEAQQKEIETSLRNLANDDPDFAAKYDTEQDREDDGEYTGLFIKNLENVQGDERDIIILSICYGNPPSGKMRMNFGPINKFGGEKRLNVIFSRAKENVIVVSSIKAPMITNDYNFGANTLKTYLQYAEALSVGNLSSARSALRVISMGSSQRVDLRKADVSKSLSQALQDNGWHVEDNVGLSSFTIDLALTGPKDRDYRIAVLLDTRGRYTGGDVEETFTARANILEAFGWQVICVPLTQWWENPDSVVALIGKP